MLDTMLHQYNPEYIFLDNLDFVEAINKAALEKEVDLIITIPKKWDGSIAFSQEPYKTTGLPQPCAGDGSA